MTILTNYVIKRVKNTINAIVMYMMYFAVVSSAVTLCYYVSDLLASACKPLMIPSLIICHVHIVCFAIINLLLLYTGAKMNPR